MAATTAPSAAMWGPADERGIVLAPTPPAGLLPGYGIAVVSEPVVVPVLFAADHHGVAGGRRMAWGIQRGAALAWFFLMTLWGGRLVSWYGRQRPDGRGG
jgi:hypothetical protein